MSQDGDNDAKAADPVSDDPKADPKKQTAGAKGIQESEGLNQGKAIWSFAVAAVAWLASIIGPALTFDIQLSLGTDSTAFKAFFMVFAGVLLLLVWRQVARLNEWSIAGILLIALVGFLGYTLLRDSWTCAYYPLVHEDRLVMGVTFKDSVLQDLTARNLLGRPCEEIMERWGGNASQIWTGDDVRNRFLMLYGLFTLAWLSLALAILAAVRRFALKLGR